MNPLPEKFSPRKENLGKTDRDHFYNDADR
jgi:hypothetical protein